MVGSLLVSKDRHSRDSYAVVYRSFLTHSCMALPPSLLPTTQEIVFTILGIPQDLRALISSDQCRRQSSCLGCWSWHSVCCPP